MRNKHSGDKDGGRRRCEDGFEATVRTYGPDMYRYARWLCRDRVIAEDLVQEVFARAWKSWDALRDPAAIKAWLFAILRNENARRFSRHELPLADTPLEEIELPVPSSDCPSWEIADLIGLLPVTYREPLVLQVLGGFTCAEIAALLGTTEGAVMTRLTRARQALRVLLDPVGQRKAS